LCCYYSHIELRKFIQLGGIITKVFKSFYYLETCEPFKEYVDTLYKKRLEYQEDKSPQEIVPKLLMNSLYGGEGMPQNIPSSSYNMVNSDKNGLKERILFLQNIWKLQKKSHTLSLMAIPDSQKQNQIQRLQISILSFGQFM